ncbi:DUF1513 domain-containing protein [Algicella marina]|uniref:DUF1513 domain-containing protein n=1 Tax=Algicella marina TaxID=2683284 RepID=A0A6P1T073_9RHOB|nr:DUF1513 domain-containing protein [Algicella marina]QHQ35260.1 DUF1513 domain-containing protein [Algicella marina]
MATRRTFLKGLAAAGLTPHATWAAAGGPAFLTAGMETGGSYVLCGLDINGEIIFRLPLPDRGHAAAAHPRRPEAVAFARRPGTFAMVLDCGNGVVKAMLEAPSGRHFYGHGEFSKDGETLYTTENGFQTGVGYIGVWDARDYRRIGEFSSGGIGPHDIKRLPGSDMLVVANGGIDTHPDSGRTKLNLPTMKPNLSYVSDGQIRDQVELLSDWHKNSIRHLAVAEDGMVAFGMQWEGEGLSPPLIGLHQIGSEPRFLCAADEIHEEMQGYVGSIALSKSGDAVAATSPRGGVVQIFATRTGNLVDNLREKDVGGIATLEESFAITSGNGIFRSSNEDHKTNISQGVAWDNHLISV